MLKTHKKRFFFFLSEWIGKGNPSSVKTTVVWLFYDSHIRGQQIQIQIKIQINSNSSSLTGLRNPDNRQCRSYIFVCFPSGLGWKTPLVEIAPSPWVVWQGNRGGEEWGNKRRGRGPLSLEVPTHTWGTLITKRQLEGRERLSCWPLGKDHWLMTEWWCQLLV